MKILFIAPLPQPVNGQSKASQAVLDALDEYPTNINVVNLSKTSLKNGVSSIKRLFQLFKIFNNIWKHRKGNYLIYFSLSESTLGNIKDFIVYMICFKSLNKMYIHMLGGAGMKVILEKQNILTDINIFFFKKLRGIIVEGSLNHELFSRYIPAEKVHIIPNFVDDYLITNRDVIREKFENISPLNILYLSNLIPGKGYLELANAFINLEKELKINKKLTFVGGFETKNSETEFLTLIADHKNIVYIGSFIDGKAKKELYDKTHIFCLPTYYPFEGQPISILETYAAGCYVITTNHSGIPFVFSHNVNGLEVEKNSVTSLMEGLKNIFCDYSKLLPIALHNADIASRMYTKSIFQKKVLSVLTVSKLEISEKK